MNGPVLWHVTGRGTRPVLFRQAVGHLSRITFRRGARRFDRRAGRLDHTWSDHAVDVPRADLFATEAEALAEYRRRRVPVAGCAA